MGFAHHQAQGARHRPLPLGHGHGLCGLSRQGQTPADKEQHQARGRPDARVPGAHLRLRPDARTLPRGARPRSRAGAREHGRHLAGLRPLQGRLYPLRLRIHQCHTGTALRTHRALCTLQQRGRRVGALLHRAQAACRPHRRGQPRRRQEDFGQGSQHCQRHGSVDMEPPALPHLCEDRRLTGRTACQAGQPLRDVEHVYRRRAGRHTGVAVAALGDGHRQDRESPPHRGGRIFRRAGFLRPAGQGHRRHTRPPRQPAHTHDSGCPAVLPLQPQPLLLEHCLQLLGFGTGTLPLRHGRRGQRRDVQAALQADGQSGHEPGRTRHQRDLLRLQPGQAHQGPQRLPPQRRTLHGLLRACALQPARRIGQPQPVRRALPVCRGPRRQQALGQRDTAVDLLRRNGRREPCEIPGGGLLHRRRHALGGPLSAHTGHMAGRDLQPGLHLPR